MVLHHTTHPDNKDPLNKRQTKARNGPISSCSWSSQTERQEKSNPVEEEWHWESRRKAAGQDTFIFQDKKKHKPLALRFFLVLHKHKCDPNYSGSLLAEKFIPSGTYRRKSAWKCHHFLSSAGQCHQSHPGSQSHHPAMQRRQHMGDLGESSPHSNPTSGCDSSKKGLGS